jgi:hypothetical protein
MIVKETIEKKYWKRPSELEFGVKKTMWLERMIERHKEQKKKANRSLETL